MTISVHQGMECVPVNPTPTYGRDMLSYSLGGFKTALLQNPCDMIRGQFCSDMLQVLVSSQSYDTESRRDSPKVRVPGG